MNSVRVKGVLLLNVAARSVALIFLLTAVITASEAALFFGHFRYTIWTYLVLLFALSLAPLIFEGETVIFQAFALIPVFRLVNLSMPVFVELTLFWLPLIYGPFIPVFVYFGWEASADETDASRTDRSSVAATRRRSHELPAHGTDRIGSGLPRWLGGNQGGKLRWLLRRIRAFLAPPAEDLSLLRSIPYWLVRAFFALLLPLVAIASLIALFLSIVYLSAIEYQIIMPGPLIPSLDLYQLSVLAVIMIGFVGFVEELLFRGILQKVLERELGLIPALLLASGIFGLMHSGYGVPMEILFAAGIGLLFGIIYDVTDSLLLVSVMHGLMSVFLFGVIPLIGASPIDLLEVIVAQELQRVGWSIDTLPLFAF